MTATSQNRIVIYDFGANNGDDIPYYLLKADCVVAVEANPALADGILQRFPGEVRAGRLQVENCVLAETGALHEVDFYIHKTNHVLSQFPKPADESQFDRVLLPSKTVAQIIGTHGAPFYIKVDIERYDAVILRELFTAGIRPPYLSAESHSVEVFALMVALGGYRAFNLVDGASVRTQYGHAMIKTSQGSNPYCFPCHSAGPFGEDLLGEWMTPDNFFIYLAQQGLGWKDIHASNVIQPNEELYSTVRLRPTSMQATEIVKRLLPAPLHPAAKWLKSILARRRGRP